MELTVKESLWCCLVLEFLESGVPFLLAVFVVDVINVTVKAARLRHD